MSAQTRKGIRTAAWQLLATVVLLGLGWDLVGQYPQGGLTFTAGAGLIGAALSLFIDWIESPFQPPDRLAVAVVSAAFILVAGW